ncbi:IDEAL domain-containing protein (plasmid) [Rossellomorea sp. AcN35-11]|nr:IDEAL domain-containing protein [Rossellomorea aquimaris]WJV31784.1 IDEAL domain-containing protein [Rossellomorea sp. AcN35-11]
MKQTSKTYKILVELFNRGTAIVSEIEVELISDIYLQSHIWEGTDHFRSIVGEEPEVVIVKVVNEEGKMVESKLYSFDWKENDTFQLIERKVAINSDLINLNRDIEDELNKEINQHKKRELLKEIDEALDMKDEEKFMNLTEALKEIQTGTSDE